MALYTSETVQHFDSEYIIATLHNQAYDLRRAAKHCRSDVEARRALERAEELEIAASLLDLAGDKIAAAYQIIGSLSDAASTFGDHGVIRALDYMAECLDVMDEKYAFAIERPTLRMRLNDWFRIRRNKIRRYLGHRHDWEQDAPNDNSSQ
jgi:hypothetical protein